MKIIVIGATGTIGKSVVKLLAQENDVVAVAHRSGVYQVDLSSRESIESLYEQVAPFSAVVCAAGLARFGKLAELTDDDFLLGLNNKLLGQVNLVRAGIKHMADNGSFTLTSGVLARQPMPGSAAISMVNGAIEAFVKAAALEMPRGMRINAVSPGWVKETLEAMGRDSSGALSADQVALAYHKSIYSEHNGKIIDARMKVDG